jgi:hypothetical protein
VPEARMGGDELVVGDADPTIHSIQLKLGLPQHVVGGLLDTKRTKRQSERSSAGA